MTFTTTVSPDDEANPQAVRAYAQDREQVGFDLGRLGYTPSSRGDEEALDSAAAAPRPAGPVADVSRPGFDLDSLDGRQLLPVHHAMAGDGAVQLVGRERDHMRDWRSCSDPRATIEWTIGHLGERRAVVVAHEAIADLVGRPGATGMLIPWGLGHLHQNEWRQVTYTAQSIHDRHALLRALTQSEAPDYPSVFYDRVASDGGLGSTAWVSRAPNTYVCGPHLEDVEWYDCFYCATYVYHSWACVPRVVYEVVDRGEWLGVLVAHRAIARLLQVPDALGIPRAVHGGVYDAASMHQFRDLKHALAASGSPVGGVDTPVAPRLYGNRTCLWVRRSRARTERNTRC